MDLETRPGTFMPFELPFFAALVALQELSFASLQYQVSHYLPPFYLLETVLRAGKENKSKQSKLLSYSQGFVPAMHIQLVAPLTL